MDPDFHPLERLFHPRLDSRGIAPTDLGAGLVAAINASDRLLDLDDSGIHVVRSSLIGDFQWKLAENPGMSRIFWENGI